MATAFSPVVKTRNGLIEEKQLATKLYLSAERVSREDEFEHHLQIARDRNLGIEIQEFYLPELMWGNWKPRLEQYKQLLEGFDNGLSIHNAFYCTDHAGLDPEIFRLTRMRYDYIFKIAQELGCGTIVSHFMWLPRYKGSHLTRWQEAEVVEKRRARQTFDPTSTHVNAVDEDPASSYIVESGQ